MLKLSTYQIEGSNFLAANKTALLADQPGVGKTAQFIEACRLVAAEKILIICPAVARVNWRREFFEWTGWEFTVCETLKDTPTAKCIVSYDYATENYEFLMLFKWDVVGCDESHFIKEPEAKRTRAIYGKTGIIRNTDRFWNLSGTPAPNHAGELWAMLLTFGATKDSYAVFVQRFCDTKPTFYGGRRYNKIIGTKKAAIPALRKLLSKVMLRRLKKDVLKDLPPIYFEQLSVTGTPLAEIIEIDMQKVADEAAGLKQLFDSEDPWVMAAVLESLGDSVSTLRRYVGLQKVAAVAEIVDMELTVGAYDKIIIFAIHTEVISNLKKLLNVHNPVVVNGKVSPKNRQHAIDSFQSDANCKVFIGNIIAAGTAINLTSAHEVLFAEESWVPGENTQGGDRAHRRGQRLPVRVRMASLADSIDEKVTGVLKRKAQQLSEIFDG